MVVLTDCKELGVVVGDEEVGEGLAGEEVSVR